MNMLNGTHAFYAETPFGMRPGVFRVDGNKIEACDIWGGRYSGTITQHLNGDHEIVARMIAPGSGWAPRPEDPKHSWMDKFKDKGLGIVLPAAIVSGLPAACETPLGTIAIRYDGEAKGKWLDLANRILGALPAA